MALLEGLRVRLTTTKKLKSELAHYNYARTRVDGYDTFYNQRVGSREDELMRRRKMKEEERTVVREGTRRRLGLFKEHTYSLIKKEAETVAA